MHTFFYFSLLCLLSLPGLSSVKATTVLLLAEDFQFHGGWATERRSHSLGKNSLRSGNSDLNAVTAIEIPEGGEYTVWARAMDYPNNRPGTRRLGVAVNGQRLPTEAGRSGANGWGWDNLGTIQLSAGTAALEIVDTTKYYGRIDAIFLSTDLDPSSLTGDQLLAHQIKPLPLKPILAAGSVATRATTFHPVHAIEPTALASVENDLSRITFHMARGPSGDPLITRKTYVRPTPEADWKQIPNKPSAETLLLLHAKGPNIDTTRFTPRWRNPDNLQQVHIGNKTYDAGYSDENNPWVAAATLQLAARNARIVDANTVELTLSDDDAKFRATLLWSAGTGGNDFAVTANITPATGGYYSIAFAPFSMLAGQDVSFHLLPPLYQFKRAPRSPNLILSSITPHPLVFVQAYGDITLGVTGAPVDLPFEWPNSVNSRYGFALLNSAGGIQPTAFQPVLGLTSSYWGAGAPQTLHWHVVAQAQPWTEALAYAAESIFQVTDYRHPVETSLTDSALNMIDLMMDPAGGWNSHLKGFWNIEGPGIVTQAAPLAILSAAVLTENENLYAQRALPSLEYLLTRPIAHFALEVPTTYPAYVKNDDIRITTPNHYYKANVWQGFDALTDNQNPWFAPLVERAARGRIPQPWLPRFAELLALYRQSPSEDLLTEILAEANTWVQRALLSPKKGEMGVTRFYNHTFIPVWWDLISLYDITADKRWIEAAEIGGMLTVAGQRSQPSPINKEELITIHPNDRFVGNQALWWRGAEPYRRGYPRKPGDVTEHTVPAWIVSPVGLGLEQPSTFFNTGQTDSEGFQNITMSSWAPALLRLYAHTGRTVFRDFARDTVIGRFGNYPGYYLRGFTDLVQSSGYPYAGPDVTSIYYHHIPPHLAFTLDWLFAEAELRSNQAIRFPWVQQAGYAWFNNRIFGLSGGEVFGHDQARPLLPKGINVPDKGLNWIAARTPGFLWIILMNDAPAPRPAHINLDTAALHIDTSQPPLVYLANNEAPQDFTPSLSIPPRGLVALRYVSEEPEPMALPPVAAQPIAVDLGEPWGTLRVWRIRSPFQKDSLFVSLSGRPKQGSKVTLVAGKGLSGDLEADQFPYEFSIYPIPANQTLSFRLRLTHFDGTQTLSDVFNLAGTHQH